MERSRQLGAGAASGMGASTGKCLFVSEGAQVLVTDMDVRRGQAVANELGLAAHFVPAMCRRRTRLRRRLSRQLRSGDVWMSCLVNVGFGGARGPIQSISEDDFDITVDVFFKGVFFWDEARRAGNEKSGLGFDYFTDQFCRRSASGGVAASLYRSQSCCDPLNKISSFEPVSTRYE